MADKVQLAKSKVKAWAAEHRQVVACDEPGSVILDVASGKGIKLNWPALREFEEKIHPETAEPYLVLLFQDGLQMALVDPGGIAFAPSTANCGSVPGLPSVVCLRDYFTLKQRIDHYLFEHPDDALPRECLDVLLICLATLDGARAVGFDIGDLERELEKSLAKIERRIP